MKKFLKLVVIFLVLSGIIVVIKQHKDDIIQNISVPKEIEIINAGVSAYDGFYDGADASYTDLCSMEDYRFSLMPTESQQETSGSVIHSYFNGESGNFVYPEGINAIEYYDVLSSAHKILSDYGTFFYSVDTAGCYMTPKSDDSLNIVATVSEWCDSTINELSIDNTTTQREAIRLINRFLSDYLSYPEDVEGEGHDIYDSLTTREGVCHVYSVLFQMLCQRCGINCYYIRDDEQNHAYNKIIFSDGKELYCDTTWNDVYREKCDDYYNAFNKYIPDSLLEKYNLSERIDEGCRLLFLLKDKTSLEQMYN